MPKATASQNKVSLVIHETPRHCERAKRAWQSTFDSRNDEKDSTSLASESKQIISPSFAGRHNVVSPSLCGVATLFSPSLCGGGLRGWVNPTSALKAKSATTNAKHTHPQTPSAEGGGFRKSKHAYSKRWFLPTHAMTINRHCEIKSFFSNPRDTPSLRASEASVAIYFLILAMTKIAI